MRSNHRIRAGSVLDQVSARVCGRQHAPVAHRAAREAHSDYVELVDAVGSWANAVGVGVSNNAIVDRSGLGCAP